MGIYDIRRARLRKLIDDRYKGKQVLLANAIEVQPDYISRVLKGTKNLGEDLANRIETKLHLARGWLSSDNAEKSDEEILTMPGAWPFSTSRPVFDQLSSKQKKAIDRMLSTMIEGFEVPDPGASKRQTSKQGNPSRRLST